MPLNNLGSNLLFKYAVPKIDFGAAYLF